MLHSRAQLFAGATRHLPSAFYVCPLHWDVGRSIIDRLMLLGVLAGNDFTQDIKINVVQFVDIQTCNGFLVLAEPGVERLCIKQERRST